MWVLLWAFTGIMRGPLTEVQLECDLEELDQSLSDALPIIKNMSLALTSGKEEWVQVQNTWQGRSLHFINGFYVLISSYTDTHIVPIVHFPVIDQIQNEYEHAYIEVVVILKSFTVHPHRLCWHAGFTCLGLTAPQ